MTLTHEEWLAERRLGVGSSDAASVFSVGYGCRLRLWRDKRGETPDYAPAENDAMELGKVLEPHFAAKYAGKTGREVMVKVEPVVHPLYPWMRCNVDRLINDTANPARNVGVLEIKAQGRATFAKTKREGLAEDYILQLNHAMVVTDAEWGSFAIGSRDSGELLYFDVERDQVLSELLISEERAFWQQARTGDMPARLEPDDPRCQRCEYRRSCQGAALIQIEPHGKMERDETLRPLLAEYLERKALMEEAEELLDETKEELKTQLGSRAEVEVANHKIYYRQQIATLWQAKDLAAAYSKLRSFVLANMLDEGAAELLTGRFPDASWFQKQSASKPLRIF